jgi:predicted O-methyltransferase YrrM
VSLEEARFLTELVRSLEHPGPIVEIGTLFGKSTLALAFGKSMDRALLTVDSYCWNPHGYTPDEHFAITKAVLEDACRNFGVEQVRQDKRDYYSDWLARERPAPALVFLDADHSAEATLEDIAWARKAKAHLICGHDYTPRIPGVVEAVDASGGPERLVGTIWVLRQEARPASVLRSKAARA